MEPRAMVGKAVKILAVTVVAVASAWGGGSDFDRAYKFYNLTQFEESLKVLHSIPSKDASVYELMGRDYYMLSEYKKATEVLDKAAVLDPQSSVIALWAGRAQGRRAETSS